MTREAARPGILFVVSAPSGTGKTTVVERLVERVSDLAVSCSYTSRPPRSGERDGVDYNFIGRAEFSAMIARGELLEWAELFGHQYGTAAADTNRSLEAGHDLVLVIDTQGARQVRAQHAQFVSVFILPPSFAVLEERLRRRSKDTEEAIRRRLDVARDEVRRYREYDYVIVNDELESCVDRLRAIVIAERARRVVAERQAESIVRTFGLDDRERVPVSEDRVVKPRPS